MATSEQRLRVVATAYACAPNTGSETGIGWNIVREVAREHEVWVITRANNRAVIEAELAHDPAPHLQVVYFDLPAWTRWWKRGTRGLYLYYYLWQIGAARKARALHQTLHFDLTHHVTFGQYWTPSFLPRLGLPFVWGPIGGGESTPQAFRSTLGLRGRLYEFLRDAARWLGEHDPFVRRTARRCTVALATTTETAHRLHRLAAPRVRILGNAALNRRDLQQLAALPDPPAGMLRFVSIGRLLHWKGFHLGLEAFARLDHPQADYWIVGDGPDRNRLEQHVRRLGLADRVRFFGHLSREATLQRLAQSHVLVHPSLHDSGGWACIEAMAAGRPVVCLDLGGPALLVTPETGEKIPADNPEQAVRHLADAMRRMAEAPGLRLVQGREATARARASFTWEARAEAISQAYRTAVSDAISSPVPEPTALPSR